MIKHRWAIQLILWLENNINEVLHGNDFYDWTMCQWLEWWVVLNYWQLVGYMIEREF